MSFKALCIITGLIALHAQFGNEAQKPLPPPAVTWTSAEDQKNMMHQIGIKALRPRAGGDEIVPNHMVEAAPTGDPRRL